ncbi:YeeE/YedE family protein [soil metagenome]
MSDFTPISAIAGGALIGLSASIVLAYHGRVAGVSGILDGALAAPRKNVDFRIPFLAGLVLLGFVASFFFPRSFGPAVVGLVPLAIAGVLVGFGTRLSNGCTSGHGISGSARLSLRSLVATVTFIAVGMITTFVVLHLRGGA